MPQNADSIFPLIKCGCARVDVASESELSSPTLSMCMPEDDDEMTVAQPIALEILNQIALIHMSDVSRRLDRNVELKYFSAAPSNR